MNAGMRLEVLRSLPTPVASWVWRFFHNSLADGTGMACRSRRLRVTPGRAFGVLAKFPLASFFSHRADQRRHPASHSVRAYRALDLPELLGPMNTTWPPSSISTSSKHLKLVTRRRVIMGG